MVLPLIGGAIAALGGAKTVVPAAAMLGAGFLGSSSARSTASAQRQAAQDQAAAQERIARQQMDFANRLYGEQQAQMYPRQQASNRALAQVSGMLGLGDIYGAPEAGSLGGGQEFYPNAPVQGTYQQASNAPNNTMFQGVPGSGYAQYVNAYPDLQAEYQRLQGYAPFGSDRVPQRYDLNRNNRLDADEYGRFHYEVYGGSEGRQLPEGLFF